MILSASFGGNFVLPVSRCDSCARVCFFSPRIVGWKLSSRCLLRKNSGVISRVSESGTEPESNKDEERNSHGEEGSVSSDSTFTNDSEPDSQNVDNNELAESAMLETKGLVNNGPDGVDDAQVKNEDNTDVRITSGSPLPGVKQREFDESIIIAKETIDVLKDQVFGFDTFFITSQEPYEGGVLFREIYEDKLPKVMKR